MTDDENIDDRLDDLEVSMQTLEAKLNQMVQKRLENLEQTVDEQDAEIDELQATVDDQRSHITTLQEKLAGLAGLQENEESTAKKRRRDLLVALQRKAEKDGGRAAMDYNDILDQWAVLGHGKKDPKQAYRAMEKLDDVMGVTNTTNGSGQEVVRINLEKFDASTAFGGVDNVNNAGAGDGSKKAVSHGD